MYISDWERLSHYWQPENREEVEGFLRRICGISPQRWHSWIELYDRDQHGEEKQLRIRPLLRWKKKKWLNDKPLRWSASLQAVLREAEQLAPFRDTVEGRTIPILTSECVLLCIARTYGSEIGRKLAATGLDAARLERDALFPKRAPLL
jgi:hypothetical protein